MPSLDHGAPAQADLPLTSEERIALQKACCPADLLSFPPAGIIANLRRSGYVEIVPGGLQITQRGLEPVLRERGRFPEE